MYVPVKLNPQPHEKTMETILQQARKAHVLLKTLGIQSVITGDLAMTHHGVDTVLQCIEICIRRQAWHAAISALSSHKDYIRIHRDVADFYHPYKRHAAVFEVEASPVPLLHLVDDSSLPLTLQGVPAMLDPSLDCAEQVNDPSQHTVSDFDPMQIIWPSLRSFLTVWIHLATQAETAEERYAYMAWADRLIESNGIDPTWCRNNIPELCGSEVLNALLRERS